MNTPAYDKHLPCLNPNCKSHGKSHPNCRCYGFATGGEVARFCSSPNMHNPNCEYFFDGGAAGWDSLSTAPPAESESSWDSLSKRPIQSNDSWDSLSKEQPENNDDDYLETAKAFGEGALQGIAGPLAPMAEVASGLTTKEGISRRQERHPVAHGIGEAGTLVGGLLTGTGEAGLIAKGAGIISEASELGRVGSLVLKSAVEASSFAASDEMTKSFLGRPGSDPEHPVSAVLLNVGASGLLGGLTGGAFSLGEGMIGKGIESLGSKKGISAAEKLLDKLGNSKAPLDDLGVSRLLKKQAHYITAPVSASGAAFVKGAIPVIPYNVAYEMIQSRIAPIAEGIANRVISKANPYAADAVIRAIMTNEVSGLPNAVHYAIEAGKGAKKAVAGVGALFKAGSSQISEPVSDYARDKIKEFIEGGQVDKQLQNSMGDQAQGQNFAHGGEVKSEPNSAFARVFPEQNTLLNTAKGRISGYLNSIRPLSNQQKKAFDKEIPNKEQNRQYDKAIDIAINPLSILDRVNKGELTSDHMKHFVSMYPEVHRFLSKEMTKQITEAQISGEKPPFSKRQSMSLFLGADLDSCLSPMAIQTIQGLYAQKNQAIQQQVQKKDKKGTSSLSKVSQSYQTGDQSREKRYQNQKA